MEPEWAREARERSERSMRESRERSEQSMAEMRRKQEREQDRRDEDRRHKERLRATKASPVAEAHSDSVRSATGSGRGLKLLATGAIILLMIVGFNYFSASRNSPPVSTAPALEALEKGQPVDPDLTDEGEETTAESDASATSEQVLVAAEESGTSDVPKAVLTTNQLRGPTLQALDTGSSVAWDGETDSGSVSVSAAVQVRGKTCRNVSYTNGGVVASAPVTWCRPTGEAEWRQQE